MAQESYSLFELNSYVKQVLALNFEVAIWIEAEISQVNVSRGHMYIDLIEQDETTEAVKAHARSNIWAGQLSMLKRKHGAVLNEVLQDGQNLKLLVKVQFHERWGYSLNVQDIDPAYTIGKLALERERVLQKLKEEQLVDKNKAHPLPAVLQKIAIISSETAAGLKDFEETLFQNDYGYAFDIDLYAAAMQGARTEPEITHILSQVLGSEKNEYTYDLVVIIRGGGSRIDLAAFDGIEMARAIANCSTPVWTGIGHEIDVAIADMVSHTQFKTPTAVAERIINHNKEYEQELLQITYNIQQSAEGIVQSAQSSLEQIRMSLLGVLKDQRTSLDLQWGTLKQRIQFDLERREQSLNNQASLITALDPELVLRRGFTITTMSKKNPKDLKSGDHITTQWSDHSVSSEVK